MTSQIRVKSSTVKFITRAMAVLGGMAAIVIVLIFEALAIAGLGKDSLSIYLCLGLVPAVTEEPFKQLGLMIAAFKQPKWISSKGDGLIAGALAGLSFGGFESLFYIMGGAGLERILTILMHTGTSALGGLGIYHGCRREYGRMVLWIWVAIGIHLAWNSLAILITQL